jgi:hypothetical protein
LDVDVRPNGRMWPRCYGAADLPTKELIDSLNSSRDKRQCIKLSELGAAGDEGLLTFARALGPRASNFTDIISVTCWDCFHVIRVTPP